MEIIDVEFDENSKIHLEPIYKYKRCWRSLWILKCAYPNYVLKHEINAILTLKDENVIQIKVKEGFKSDLASIPRIFWGIYPPDGNYGKYALLHDALYSSELFKREICDKIFELGLKKEVSSSIRKLFYYSVKIFGRSAWNSNTPESIIEALKFVEKH